MTIITYPTGKAILYDIDRDKLKGTHKQKDIEIKRIQKKHDTFMTTLKRLKIPYTMEIINQ